MNGVLKDISYSLRDVLKTGGVSVFIFILPRLYVKLKTFFLFMPNVEILFCATMFGKKSKKSKCFLCESVFRRQ